MIRSPDPWRQPRPLRRGGQGARLRVLGAAGQVTGSAHLLELDGLRLLLDCGLVQGSRQSEAVNRQAFPFDAARLDAVVLSHAHIDHSGRLPLLVRRGYRGPVYAHPATIDLCRVLLSDAARIAEHDYQRELRHARRDGRPVPLSPLYGQAEVDRLMDCFVAVEFDQEYALGADRVLRLREAGHMLGASIVAIDIPRPKRRLRLVYSGDLGPYGSPLAPAPQPVHDADLVVMESTYGDRDHRSREATVEEIGVILREAAALGGNVLVPAFSVGRSQELLYWMAQHYADWGLSRWRIFLDSPMAVAATAVYRRHARLLPETARRYAAQSPSQWLPKLQVIDGVEASMALNEVRGGAIIIAGSGMCSGGRIVHHLVHHAGDPATQILIIGYQARGTPGRRLVDGTQTLRLLGRRIPVRARVHTVGGLSAHAGRSELLRWYGELGGNPAVMLVHGEARARAGLAQGLEDAYGVQARLPVAGEACDLDAL